MSFEWRPDPSDPLFEIGYADEEPTGERRRSHGDGLPRTESPTGSRAAEQSASASEVPALPEGETEYEFKDVRAVRGFEARTIAKWEKERWELVSQTRGSPLHTNLAFRRPKPKTAWLRWAVIGGSVLVLAVAALTFSALRGGGDPVETTPPPAAASVAPSEQPSGEPTPEEESVDPAPPPLSDVVAAQYLALAWEDKFVYGGTVHWIVDRITTENDDGSYTFKIGATVRNEYGAEFEAVIEGDVGGTDDNPVILDSILYTNSGDVVSYYG